MVRTPCLATPARRGVLPTKQMKNMTEENKFYFRITNAEELGKYAHNTDNLVLSGDVFYGVSDIEVEPGVICRGSTKVSKIEPIEEIYGGLEEDLEKLDLSTPESVVPKRWWTVLDEVMGSDKPKWMKITQCMGLGKLDLDFILPGLPRKSVGTLVSPGGTGKSMAVLQTAAHCVLGIESFLNQSTTKRTVAYLSLEDPPAILHNRLHDLYEKLNPSREQSARLDEHLLAASLTLSVATSKDNPSPHAIIDLFEPDQKPDLIILDTARRAHQLDENSAGEMSTFIATLEEAAEYLNCAFFILHHTSKGAMFAKSQGTDPGASASRGSSVLVDNARAVWAMHVMNTSKAKELEIADAERRQYIELTHEKCNYQRAMSPTLLKRDDLGLFDAVKLNEEKGQKHEKESLF